MNRSNLIAALAAEKPHLSNGEVARAVETMFSKIIDGLEAGGRVELRGFGVFHLRIRAGGSGRNPRTGEAIKVAPKSLPAFRAGKPLAVRLNPSRP